MREVLLLWGFTVAGLVAVAVVVVLALGVMFGVVRLMWHAIRAIARMGKARGRRRDGVVRERFDDPRVSGRLWFTGRQRDAGMQGRLVPASACVARGGVARLERRQPAGPRSRCD